MTTTRTDVPANLPPTDGSVPLVVGIPQARTTRHHTCRCSTHVLTTCQRFTASATTTRLGVPDGRPAGQHGRPLAGGHRCPDGRPPAAGRRAPRVAAAHRGGAAGVLHHRRRRSVVEPGALRRHPLWCASWLDVARAQPTLTMSREPLPFVCSAAPQARRASERQMGWHSCAARRLGRRCSGAFSWARSPCPPGA